MPIRYGRMLVSPFTFYRGAAYIMAADLAGTAAYGAARAAVRRRAPLELRCLRGPGPAARVRHERLRRDAAGAVRVGCQAARRQLRGGRPGPRLRQAPAACDHVAVSRSYRQAMAAFASMPTLDLWYSRIDSDDIYARMTREVSAKASQAGGAQRSEGPHQGQPRRVQEAHAHGRRRAADRQRSAADRPDLGALHAARRRWRPHGSSSASTGGRCKATAVISSSASGSSTRPGRSWASAASGRGRSSCSSSAATTRIRCSSR